MATSHLSARLRYLQDSANLLSATSPETSAYLMSQANQLMFDNEIQPTESYRRHICGACGSIMVPGWTSTLEKEVIQGKSRRQNTKSRATNQRTEKKGVDNSEKNMTTSSMVYKCGLCRKQTRHRLPIYSVPAVRKSQKQFSQAASLPIKTVSNTGEKAAATSANTSSKKRARNRKQGGLQALLAAKKENGPSGSSLGFGLDLMDLMKRA